MPAPPPESEPATVRTRRGARGGVTGTAPRSQRRRARLLPPRLMRFLAAAPARQGQPGGDEQDQRADRLRQGEVAEEAVVLAAPDLDPQAPPTRPPAHPPPPHPPPPPPTTPPPP